MAAIESSYEEFQRELRAFMGRLAAFDKTAQHEIQPVMTQALLMLAGEMGRYPPPPPGSTYRRKGTLGRLWIANKPQVRISGSVFEGRIGNAAPHARYVQGPDEQAEIHKERWRDTDDVLEATEPAIEMLLNRAGLSMAQKLAGA